MPLLYRGNMKKLYLNYSLRITTLIILIAYYFFYRSDGDELLPFALIILILLVGLYSLFKIDKKRVEAQGKK